MNILLHNFKTINKTNIEAILINNKTISNIGSFHLLKKIATNPEIIDLNGNLLLPAFTDAHTHFVETAKQQLTCNVLNCKTDDDFYEKLIEYRDNYHNMLNNLGCTSPPLWIKGYGWEKKDFDNFHSINKHLIDKVFPDIPVSIASRDLHSNLCNSKALEIIGKVSESYNIQIGKFTNGEPNGYLYENSWTILDKFIPALDEKLLKKLVCELIKKAQKFGLCGVHSIEDIKAAKLVRELVSEVDFYFTWYYLGTEMLDTDRENFRSIGIKLFADGSLGSDSACLFENKPNTPIFTSEQMKTIIEAHQKSIQISIHAIGDYAVYATANMFKELNKKYGYKLKHRIEHLQAVRPEDINLLKEANIHASMQAVHIKNDAELICKKWKTASRYSYPIRSVSDVVEMALGSDAPVETLNPFEGIRYATNRDVFLPHEAISMQDAINAYTYKHHIIANQPITYGMLEVGQIANLIVVKDDILNTTETEMTIINGKIVS